MFHGDRNIHVHIVIVYKCHENSYFIQIQEISIMFYATQKEWSFISSIRAHLNIIENYDSSITKFWRIMFPAFQSESKTKVNKEQPENATFGVYLYQFHFDYYIITSLFIGDILTVLFTLLLVQTSFKRCSFFVTPPQTL